MAGLTDHYSLPYPQGTDDAAIASDIQALAVSVDSAVYTSEQTLAAADSSLSDQINSLKTNVRYTVDSVTAVAGDFIICDSPFIVTITLPGGPQEDDIVRIYRNNNGAVSITATNPINGPNLIVTKNTGIIATFTGGEWWCLPLSFSDSGSGGGYVPSPAWERPSEWIDLPITIDENTNGVYALVHIPEGVTETIALQVNGYGNYYIDWGDGFTSTVENPSSAYYIYHTYQWSLMSNDGQMSDNTRQAYILLEPISGGGIYYTFVLNEAGQNIRDYVKEFIYVLKNGTDIFAPTSTENLVVYTRGTNIDMSYLAEEESQIKRATIYCEGGSPYMRRMFYSAPQLESAYIFGSASNVDMYSAFTNSYSLKSVYIDAGVITTHIGYIFEESGIREHVPININGRTTFDSWGAYYYSSLVSADGDTITNSQYAQGLYAYALALESVSNLNLSNNVSVEDTFSDCRNLKEVSNINLSNSLNTREVFRNCYTLKKINNLTVTGTQDIRSMFSSCYALPSIDNSTIDLLSTTNANSMFNSCYSLKEVPDLGNTSNVTDAASMFYYCTSLESLPALNLSNAISASNFAAYCNKLKWSDVYGLRVAHSYQNCNLSSSALNHIYTNLGTASTGIPIVSAYWSGNYMYFITATPHGLTSNYYSTSGFSPSGYNRTNTYMTANGNQFYFYTTSNPGVATILGSIYVGASASTSITVTGNPGVSGDNPSIATAKGWTVTG